MRYIGQGWNKIYRDHHISRILYPIDVIVREIGKDKKICLPCVLSKRNMEICLLFFNNYKSLSTFVLLLDFKEKTFSYIRSILTCQHIFMIFVNCVHDLCKVCVRFV